jgi:hypothetical protein
LAFRQSSERLLSRNGVRLNCRNTKETPESTGDQAERLFPLSNCALGQDSGDV